MAWLETFLCNPPYPKPELQLTLLKPIIHGLGSSCPQASLGLILHRLCHKEEERLCSTGTEYVRILQILPFFPLTPPIVSYDSWWSSARTNTETGQPLSMHNENKSKRMKERGSRTPPSKNLSFLWLQRLMYLVGRLGFFILKKILFK